MLEWRKPLRRLWYNQPQSISFEIEAASLWTKAGPALTNHLKSPDFLDARYHTTIRFKSTSIKPRPGYSGQFVFTGDLTLCGVTRRIRLPATVNEVGDEFTIRAAFTIDRSDYGMDYDPKRVANKVLINVVIGEKTLPRGS